MAAMPRAGDDEERRPWKCCDMQLCTKSLPPICVCRDRVEQCSDACRNCEEAQEDSDGGPPRYVCHDAYRGEAAPRCNEDEVNKIIHRGTEAVAVVRGANKKENGEERPWKCCDKAVPGPTTEGAVWYCMDKMKQCTCERCLEVEDGGHHYFCLDGYEGRDPGPSCTHDG
ncbi:hypothetical protein BAE44_0010369 [Dichanthelium oligosanthes]|uniref:Bowman-Birk serine protease inhibitors family domain-containing protein n=1 Tax=Dichanthelium oligosanthes TaxID=888268 RepID=A0A1E5VU34_9POAL|nr:hypothetical protein BAE44_0010369 [Dichanthelium oligosanthes]